MLSGLLSFYSWRFPRAVVGLFQRQQYAVLPYLKAFWHTTRFKDEAIHPTATTKQLLNIVYFGSLLQIAVGLVLIGLWQWRDLAGGWAFGLAFMLSYPVVWGHLLVVPTLLWWLARPKKMGRSFICTILECQVRRLRARRTFQVVAVAGSVGKTSTKLAIAQVLQAARRVRWQTGNYNDRVTVPLIFFGHDAPELFNVFAWLRIFWQNECAIYGAYPYDVVVAEIGTDGPGFIKEFAYLKPELAVITAVTPEHMEYFKTLDAVAEEELAALDFAQQALLNIDDTPAEYLADRTYVSYGLTPKATYYVHDRTPGASQLHDATFMLGKTHHFRMTIPLLGEQGAKITMAAVAAADLLGLTVDEIKHGVTRVEAFSGRMQVLPGIENSTLIDDTYNATPLAAKAALDVVYAGDAPQRIAILGSMNELGDFSPEAHREVGEYCDPAKLDWVVTIGADAKTYLAPVAQQRGCQVKTFMDPYKAGRFVKKHLETGAVVLAKGSQNGVFAEEALKTLLADPTDEAKLVRQSPSWLKTKRKQFKP